MKEYYISPQLHIFAFAPREDLATLEVDISMTAVNVTCSVSAGGEEVLPGDIYIPIPPPEY